VKEKIIELKLGYAQAQSDKIELMRDIATYEQNACLNMSFEERMSQMLNIVEQSRDAIMNLSE
jgi:hypothetical protein